MSPSWTELGRHKQALCLGDLETGPGWHSNENACDITLSVTSAGSAVMTTRGKGLVLIGSLALPLSQTHSIALLHSPSENTLYIFLDCFIKTWHRCSFGWESNGVSMCVCVCLCVCICVLNVCVCVCSTVALAEISVSMGLVNHRGHLILCRHWDSSNRFWASFDWIRAIFNFFLRSDPVPIVHSFIQTKPQWFSQCVVRKGKITLFDQQWIKEITVIRYKVKKRQLQNRR